MLEQTKNGPQHTRYRKALSTIPGAPFWPVPVPPPYEPTKPSCQFPPDSCQPPCGLLPQLPWRAIIILVAWVSRASTPETITETTRACPVALSCPVPLGVLSPELDTRSPAWGMSVWPAGRHEYHKSTYLLQEPPETGPSPQPMPHIPNIPHIPDIRHIPHTPNNPKIQIPHIHHQHGAHGAAVTPISSSFTYGGAASAQSASVNTDGFATVAVTKAAAQALLTWHAEPFSHGMLSPSHMACQALLSWHVEATMGLHTIL